jgi:dihydroxyacetone kinase-like protein
MAISHETNSQTLTIKKVLNDPKKVVPEMLEGLIAAYHGRVKKLDGVQAFAKTKMPAGKVGLLIGGGSGHEPLFHGFVGDNMGDGAACGNVFAAPSPDTILEATRAVDQGQGVLYLYGNYAGDNMNFDIAAELAQEEGIKVETIRIWDDVASAPPGKESERRGIAGDLYMIKIAGAASATLTDLDEVVRVTQKARENLRSMGVALAAGSSPETGEPTFILPDDEIEIGMGVHGEAGVERRKLTSADEITSSMLEKILVDLPFQSGDEVVVLINNLGATTMMECLIVNRKVQQILKEKNIKVHNTDIGSFITCQEMAGFSLSLLKLDDELKKFYDMPATSFGFNKV